MEKHALTISADDHQEAAKVQMWCSLPLGGLTFTIIYFLIFVSAFPGNILVLVKMYRTPKLITANNIYMCSMSVASILLCLLSIPITPAYTFMQDWVLGEGICTMFVFAEASSIYIISMGALAISNDCFNILFKPQTLRLSMKKAEEFMVICLLLSVGLPMITTLCATVVKVNDKTICVWLWPNDYTYTIYTVITVAVQYVFPFTLSSFFNLRVRCRLATSRDVIPHPTSSKTMSTLDSESIKRRTLVVAFIGFLLFPYQLLTIIIFVFYDNPKIPGLGFSYFVSKTLVMTMTSFVPFCFMYVNKLDYMELFPCLTQHEKRSTTVWYHLVPKTVAVEPDINSRT
ncbi:hypothetical protein CHUAL_008349 [Chamberlinius hualienensis]